MTEVNAGVVPYRLWISMDNCTMVRQWVSGLTEVCLRDDPGHVWGPPIQVIEGPVVVR